MYDKDPLTSQQTAAVPCVSTAAPLIDDEAPEPALVSFNRLQSVVAELVAALNETLRDDRTNAAACVQRARAMLRVEGPLLQISTGVRGGLAPWRLRRVLAHIEANLGTPMRNKDLATIARLSEYRFNVAFRTSLGEAPHGYIIRRRVECAQGLMLSTEKPLTEIALDCGMSDQAHFSRIFRKIVGESPSAWRRARVNQEPAI